MLRKLSSRLQASQGKVDAGQVGDPAVASKPAEVNRSLPLVRDAPAAPSPAASGAGEAIQLPADCAGALILGEGEQVFPIRGEVCLIGRYDPVTGTRPEIDLTPYDTNRSVSRRHARVTASGAKLFISEEVGALNGTFVNGKRLIPGKSEPLQSGDTLALGMVLLKLQGR
jgi:hypothetical protein